MMRCFHFQVFSWLVFVSLIGSSPVSAQQQSPSPNAPAPNPNAASQPEKNCSWKATKGSGKGSSNCEPDKGSAQPNQQTPAEANPFPEAKSQKAADAADTPNAPGGSAAPQHQQTPAEANPFPEEKSRKAADAANAPTNASSGSSSSHFDVNRLNAPAGSEARISNGEGGYIHSPQLAAKDDQVGNFYLQTHDYKGAYDRFLEATRVAPEDGDAVFGLAESARGLHRTQEAITNYNIYLQAFPKGKKAKDAEKALAELTQPQKK